MVVMFNFRNLNANFETYTQTVGSRSRSHGSKFWHEWKGLVPRHVYGKYKRCISIGMGVMINKLVGANANADADANDWVTT